MREVIVTSILKRFDKKKQFFEGYFWFKFNNLGLALGMALKTKYQRGRKVKIKSQKFSGANSYICKSYKGKTGRGLFLTLQT